MRARERAYQKSKSLKQWVCIGEGGEGGTNEQQCKHNHYRDYGQIYREPQSPSA